VKEEINRASLVAGLFDFTQPFECVLVGPGGLFIASRPVSLGYYVDVASATIRIDMPDVYFKNVSGPPLERFEIDQNNEWLFESDNGFPVIPNGGDINVSRNGIALVTGMPLPAAYGPATQPYPMYMPPFTGKVNFGADWHGDRTLPLDDIKKLKQQIVQCEGCFDTGFHKGFGGPCRAAGCTAGRR
jgi:hypothetical protein